MTATSAPRNHATTPVHPLVDSLHREWQHLCRHQPSVREVNRWGLTDLPVTSLDDLLPQAEHQFDHAGQEMLSALVLRAAECDLAARIVLQRMLPGLCAVARRRATNRDERVRFIDELIAEAWLVIRRFDATRCGRFVLCALVDGCEYRVFRQGRRRMLTTECTSPDRLDLPVELEPDAEPVVELLELVSHAQSIGCLEADDLRVVAAMIGSATSIGAAAELKVTARTLRARREAITHRLRLAAAA
jgi:hypothetical protein